MEIKVGDKVILKDANNDGTFVNRRVSTYEVGDIIKFKEPLTCMSVGSKYEIINVGWSPVIGKEYVQIIDDEGEPHDLLVDDDVFEKVGESVVFNIDANGISSGKKYTITNRYDGVVEIRDDNGEKREFYSVSPVLSIVGSKELGLNELTDKIREWSEARKLNVADPNKQALKLGEEMGELFEGLAKGDEALTKDAIGDLFVVLTIISQQLGYTIEECVELAYNEIKDRRGEMRGGVFVKEEDL